MSWSKMIFYTLTGSIFWSIAQAMGAGTSISLFAGFLGPPMLLIGFFIYKYR